MIEEILEELRMRMDKSVQALKREFSRVRTGRASPALVEGIRVDCYDTSMPLNQVATITAPESRLLMVQPWDNTVIGQIEKAILKSELGLTPMNDGKIIRISIPMLTEERRRDLVKLVRKMSEETKVAARNARRDANELLKDLKKEGEIPEDEFFKRQEEVQKITDEYTKKIDEATAEKEEEVMEI